MSGLMKDRLESKLLGEISITSDMQQRRQWHPTPVLFAGKIHGREEPRRLQSMTLLRVGHD